MARKAKSAEKTSAPDPGSPEARLDDKLKAMFQTIERRKEGAPTY